MTMADLRNTQTEASDLVDRCLHGDQGAWEQLIERYGRLVYSIPRRYGLCESDADDVFQSVFSILHRRMASIRNAQRLSAWLITTAHRECRRFARLHRHDIPLNDRCLDPAEPPPQLAARWEEQHIVREALRCLPSRDRTLMEALFLGSGPADYRAIAKTVGMKQGSIGATRARCFKRLQRILIALGFDPVTASELGHTDRFPRNERSRAPSAPAKSAVTLN